VEGTIDSHQDQQALARQLHKHSYMPARPDFNQVKKHINNGYTVLQRVQHIYLSADRELTLDNHRITLVNNAVVKLAENRKENPQPPRPAEEPAPYTLLPNKGIKFRKTVWADGSEAIVDSRGLLHLRSADTDLPEITLVLVIGRAMAGWASDGTVFGSFYFTGLDTEETTSAPDFYQHYIKRFVDRLPIHATET
jgi:hypothetical protein